MRRIGWEKKVLIIRLNFGPLKKKTGKNPNLMYFSKIVQLIQCNCFMYEREGGEREREGE